MPTRWFVRRWSARTTTSCRSSASSFPPITRTNTSSPLRWPPRQSMDYPADKLNVWLLDDGGTDQEVQRQGSCQGRSRPPAARFLAGPLCAARRHLSDAQAQRARQSRQHEQCAGPCEGRYRRRVRRRSCALPVGLLRETVRGYFAQDQAPGPDAAHQPQSIRSRRTCAPSTRCRPRTKCSTASRSAAIDKWDDYLLLRFAALLPRRSALETTGGFSGITITEDCETAFELHSKGWNSVYVGTSSADRRPAA